MIRTLPAILLLAFLAVLPARAQHAGDVLMAANSAGQLLATNLPGDTVRLPFVSSGINIGWASTSLGFDRILTANPAAGLYPMAGTGMIDLEVVQIDPGLSFRSFTAFNTVIADAPGETLRMGPANVLHYHPIVFIDANTVGQEFQGTRSASVRFVDASGVNTPSAVYTLTFAPPAAVSRTYALRLLDVHDALHSSADGISNSGLVCGGWYDQNPMETGGVVHSATELQSLVPPAPSFAGIRMTAINKHAETVGTQGNDGFLRKDGVFTILTLPGATHCQPRAISDAGQIVGVASSGGGLTAWSRSPAGDFSTLPGLPGYAEHGATGINSQGNVIGYSTRPGPGGVGTESAAWLSVSGLVQAITFAGTTGFSPIAINDSGDILVSYRRSATGATLRHAVRRGTVWSELLLAPLPGMSDYRVTGLNNHGEIVGSCQDSMGRQHGFRGRPAWLPAVSTEAASLTPVWTGSQLKLSIAVAEPAAVLEPAAVTIHAGPGARRLVPPSAPWSFLGVSGTAVWMLPDSAAAGLPRLAVAPLINQGVFASDQIHLDLEKADGPGHLFVYRSDAAGSPVILMNSSDGITAADRITPITSGPEPLNWAFTAPGSWQLTFRLRGILAATGAEIVSTPQTVSIFVEPGGILPATIAFTTGGGPEPQLIVSGETGRECVLSSSEDLHSWQTTHRFLTTAPDTLLPAGTGTSRRFYQAIFR